MGVYRARLQPACPSSHPLFINPRLLWQVFEDEETRAFYESLVDVRAVVPAVLLGDKPGGKEEGGTAGGEAGNGEAAGGAGAAAAAAGEKPRGGLQASASSASVESGGVSGGTGKEREMSYDDLLEVWDGRVAKGFSWGEEGCVRE